LIKTDFFHEIMEIQKMSSQERIHSNMLSIQEEIQSLDKEIEIVEIQLKKDGLSEEEKKMLEEDLQVLEFDRLDLYADLAMLEELLAKMEMAQIESASYEDNYNGGGGLEWNESGYFD